MLSSSMPVNQARRSQSWHEMKTTGVVSVSTISTRVSSPQPQSGHTCGLFDSPKPTLAIEPSGAGGGTGRRRRAVPRFAAPFVVPLLPSALVRWCGICLSDITTCLLYTSDAADDLLCVDLGGRRIIKKKKKKRTK